MSISCAYFNGIRIFSSRISTGSPHFIEIVIDSLRGGSNPIDWNIGEIELVAILKRPIDREIGLCSVEVKIIMVEVERETLKVDVGRNYADPIVGGTTECDSNGVVHNMN